MIVNKILICFIIEINCMKMYFCKKNDMNKIIIFVI